MKTFQNLLMAFVGFVAKIFFLLYKLMATLVVVGIGAYFFWVLYLYGFCLIFNNAEFQRNWQYSLPALTIGLLLAVIGPLRKKDNPYRIYRAGLAGTIDECADGFIAWIGTLKYFTSPLSIAEDPGSYKITGREIRDLIDGRLQPGDILLRGYRGYLDGIMIGLTGGGQGLGKYFSHAAFYLGEVNDGEDQMIVARRLETMNRETGLWEPASDEEKKAIRNNRDYYQPGKQMVVHSMTRGVFSEDILTFTRCDYLAVLRLPKVIMLTPEDRKEDKSLIKELPEDAEAIHERLMKGGTVSGEEVFKIARLSALGKIGSCYDFQFNDIKTANRFSCSEFVYYCYKSVHCYLGLLPKAHAFLKVFFKRTTISPADIYDAAISKGKLEIVWTSDSLKQPQGRPQPVPAPAVE